MRCCLEILKHYAKVADPDCESPCEEGEQKYHRLDAFKIKVMDACGHDTADMCGAIERARAAIQDLHHTSELFTKQFDENPSPFVTAAADEAKRVQYEIMNYL